MQEVREAVHRSSQLRQGVATFVGVPSTWEGWAVRVLTIAVVAALLACWILYGQLSVLIRLTTDQNAFIRESRAQRLVFQQQETARQCAALEELGLQVVQLKALQCSP